MPASTFFLLRKNRSLFGSGDGSRCARFSGIKPILVLSIFDHWELEMFYWMFDGLGIHLLFILAWVYQSLVCNAGVGKRMERSIAMSLGAFCPLIVPLNNETKFFNKLQRKKGLKSCSNANIRNKINFLLQRNLKARIAMRYIKTLVYKRAMSRIF